MIPLLFLLFSNCSSSPKLASTGDEKDLLETVPEGIKEKFVVIEEAPQTAPSPQAENSAPLSPGVAVKKPTETKPKLPTVVAKQVTKSKLQYPHRRPAKDPIWVGEKLEYEITYSGLPAGTFTLTVMPHKTINDRKVYHIEGHARSSAVFSLFYRLDDYLHTYIDYDGIFSHKFTMLLDESKQKRTSIELYDYEQGETFFWDRRNHYKQGFSEKKIRRSIPLWGQDTLSSLYYLRTVAMPPKGQVIKFPLITQSKNWEAEVKVLRRELVESPLGEVKTIMLQPETKFRGILKSHGESYIWVTDDDRRIMVKMIAKVKVGAVKAMLTRVHSLGNPPQ